MGFSMSRLKARLATVKRVHTSHACMLAHMMLEGHARCGGSHAQVTVQAGCRVQQLVEALAPHGLTLQNFASIREQQIGGFIQVCDTRLHAAVLSFLL